MLSHAAEERAQKLVALQFFLLAPYVAYEAIKHLVSGEHPEVSVLGMLLTTSSLIGMPLSGRQAAGRPPARLAGHARRGHPEPALRLSGGRPCWLGLLGNALFGAWWLDPIAALFIAGVALKEGRRDLARRGLLRGGPNLDPAGAL